MRKMTVRNPHAYRTVLERRQKRRLKQELRSQQIAIEQFDKTKENIVKYMNSRFKTLSAGSLQVIIDELVTSPQVTHGITLRESNFGTYFELMSTAVASLLQDEKILLHQDQFGVVLGLPNGWPPAELLMEYVTVEDLDPHTDWSSIKIHKCATTIRRALKEY